MSEPVPAGVVCYCVVHPNRTEVCRECPLHGDAEYRVYTQSELDAATLAAAQRMAQLEAEAKHNGILEFQRGFNMALEKEPCGHTMAELKQGDSRECRTCAEIAAAALAVREQALSLLEHECDVQRGEFDPCGCGLCEAIARIRNLPLHTNYQQALERHDAAIRSNRDGDWARALSEAVGIPIGTKTPEELVQALDRLLAGARADSFQIVHDYISSRRITVAEIADWCLVKRREADALAHPPQTTEQT